MSVLRTEVDFYDLTSAYLAKVQAQGVRHVEIFFDPQAHLERGIALGTVIDGLQRALDEAKTNFGISSHLIMCFLRHLDEADAQGTLDLALRYKDQIIGIGLDSSEVRRSAAV